MGPQLHAWLAPKPHNASLFEIRVPRLPVWRNGDFLGLLNALRTSFPVNDMEKRSLDAVARKKHRTMSEQGKRNGKIRNGF